MIVLAVMSMISSIWAFSMTSGGDMVIVSHEIADADATYDAIHQAVLGGVYPRTQLDASVQRLLSLGLRYMP